MFFSAKEKLHPFAFQKKYQTIEILADCFFFSLSSSENLIEGNLTS
jgi:hypothetical protein